MNPVINHTERVATNWPYEVSLARRATLTEDLAEISSRDFCGIELDFGGKRIAAFDVQTAYWLSGVLAKAAGLAEGIATTPASGEGEVGRDE